jgi:hypothetical protein
MSIFVDVVAQIWHMHVRWATIGQKLGGRNVSRSPSCFFVFPALGLR